MHSLRNRCRATSVSMAVALLVVVGVARPGAAATMFGVTDGGVVDAVGCTSAACGASQTFGDTLSGFASVAGTLLLDTAAGTLDVSLALQDVVGLLALGGADNGVGAIDFSGVLYSVSGLSLIEIVPGSKYIIGGGQTASVTGSYAQDAGGLAPFALASARITGTCDIVGSSVTCGLGFGATDFALGIGADPQSRYFRHTMNVTGVVPEPSTGLLLGAGLVGLALRRRR